MTTSCLFSYQAGEERLHHRQVHWETLRQEEVSRYDVAAPHIVRRSEGPGHILPHPGVRWGSRPHGAHPPGQRTRQCTILFLTCCPTVVTLRTLSSRTTCSEFSVASFLLFNLLPWFSAHSSYCQGCYKRSMYIFSFYDRNKGRRRFISQSDWWTELLSTSSTSSLRTGKESKKTTNNDFVHLCFTSLGQCAGISSDSAANLFK